MIWVDEDRYSCDRRVGDKKYNNGFVKEVLKALNINVFYLKEKKKNKERKKLDKLRYIRYFQCLHFLTHTHIHTHTQTNQFIRMM